MTTSSEQLLSDLKNRTLLNIESAEHFKLQSIETLNWKATPKSWSVLECLEHLNLYGDFYIPEITKRITNSNTSGQVHFKSGIIGNYFAKMMLPKKQGGKMETFNAMNPLGSALNHATVSRFIAQQEQLLVLLEQALKVDLNKTKTAISISKLVKLRLGDTLRVVIYHNERHVGQADKAVLVKLKEQ